MALDGTSTPSMYQQHVPAWKRLGLKLKYAKDISGDIPAIHDRSETRANGTESTVGDSRPSKKRKRMGEPLSKANGINSVPVEAGQPQATQDSLDFSMSCDGNLEDSKSRPSQDLEADNGHSTTSQDDDKSEDRRKSVTFAPDAKQEDGSSALTISKQRGFDPKAKANDKPTQQSVPQPKLPELERTGLRAESGAKDESSSSGQQKESRATQSPEYVRYLDLFYKDKSHWKFHKNKQNDLLKHILDIDRIPQQHTQALVEYIGGLRGAAARRRVFESASEVLKTIAEKSGNAEDLGNMETETARQEAYKAALRRYIQRYEAAGSQRDQYDDQQLEEMRSEAERGERAEALLGELLKTDLASESTEPSSTSGTSATTPQLSNTSITSISKAPVPKSTETINRKRRKTRTSAPDDISSSSSESEGGYKPSRGPATISDALSLKGRSRFSAGVRANKATSIPPSRGKKIIFDA